MAEPYLPNAKKWQTFTLEPNRKQQIILAVDSGGTPSTKEEDFWDGDIPWLTPKELSDNTKLLYSSTERNISKHGLENSSVKMLPPDSVLLTKRAPVGLVAINTVTMGTNQGFLNFQCGKNLHHLYFAYWLRANTPYLHAVANGSTYDELYKADLFEFQIAVPPVEYQVKVLSVLSVMDFLISLKRPLEHTLQSNGILQKLSKQNNKLYELKSALTYLLLSGELDVNEIK